MLEIHVVIQKKRVLYSQSDKPVCSNDVYVSIWDWSRPGEASEKCVASKNFNNVPDGKLPAWIALQDRLAAMRA